jgi:biotin synthase-related radical SAM superfamily protein
MIIIDKLQQTCSACPSQWEGKSRDGQDICIRYRWGCLRLDINNESIYRIQIGGEWGGILSTKEMLKHLKNYITTSQESIHESN